MIYGSSEAQGHEHDGDAEFDAWLHSVDEGVLDRIETALDLDAGRAAIFATTVVPESVPGDDDEEAAAVGRSLGRLLSGQTARIEQWLAKTAPNYLPYQLDQAASTTRTMIVVGRALLSDAMPTPWELASGFLHCCMSDLLYLKAGLSQRDLDRDAAVVLHTRLLDNIESFCGVLNQCTRTSHGPKAVQVSERLVDTAEAVRILMGWTRKSIEHLFNESGPAYREPEPDTPHSGRRSHCGP